MKRIIVGVIECQHALPQHIVDEPTIIAFQQRLQLGVTTRLKIRNLNDWQLIFRDGRKHASVMRFQSFFSFEQ